MECKHNYIKLTNIDKIICIWALSWAYQRQDKLICNKCGKELR